MSKKYALIIANTEYIDSGLAQLTAPGKDAEDFARVLREKDLCAFDDVKVLVNEHSNTINEAVDEFFDQKKPDDLLLLYFSGHGVRDELGALYLAVKNTNRYRLRVSAVKSDFIKESMDQSRSRRQVLILDCCNSGAFSQGAKAATGISIGTATAFEGGYGRVILTASDSTQFAWEGDKVIGDTDNSLFTHYLVEGLEGKADRDGDGQITVDELYDYTYEKVRLATPKQTPSKFSTSQQGEIILRHNIRIEDAKPIPLPDDLITAAKSSLTYVREAAVRQLDELLHGKNRGSALSARKMLEFIAENDDSKTISRAAFQALESIRQAEQIAFQEESPEMVTKRKEAARQLVNQRNAEAERLEKEKAEKYAAQLTAKEERIAKINLDTERIDEAKRVTNKQINESTATLKNDPNLEQSFSNQKSILGQSKKSNSSLQENKQKNSTSWYTIATIALGVIGLIWGSTLLSRTTDNTSDNPESMVTESVQESLNNAPEQPGQIKVGLVTDLGGIDDKSYNATAYAGIQQAINELNVDGKYLESTQQSDYEKNIQQYLEEDTDLIVTVGYLLGDATKAAAEANPEAKFAIVDFAYAPTIPNVLGLVFATDQASFLAGYSAAASTKTGKVATWGGINIPPVTDFMIGFEAGVKYYNAQKGANVEVLGWSSEAGDGSFIGNFESLDDGRSITESLVQEGADIVMPVAGPAGLGSAAYCQESGSCMIIGVDTDWTVSASEYSSVILTSVLKNMNVAVFEAIKSVKDGTFAGSVYVGTLANNGVGLSDINGASNELLSELANIKQGIFEGSITIP